MKKVTYVGHQGDVAVFEIDAFPNDERIETAQTKNAILAYGELSGHAHQFEEIDSVDVFTTKKHPGLFFIDPKRPANLTHGRARDFTGKEADHDYHKVITLDPNKKYMTGIVHETDWLSKTVRRVID